MPRRIALFISIATTAALAILLDSSAAHAAALDGTVLSWPWALPFIGILLSIAVGPLLFKRVWHAHYGKIAFGWAALTLIPIAVAYGAGTALDSFVHAMAAEYASFIILLFALYVTAGGILVTGAIRGRPLTNTAILAFGTLIASIVGTTGAAMILIRPLLRANALRPHRAHVVVFFIFLVGNIGGALSPLGDPPLFVGFLRGIDFFWTTHQLAGATALVAAIVLIVFFVVDTWLLRHDARMQAAAEPDLAAPVRVRGVINLVLIACIIGAILVSATWKPGVDFDLRGTHLALQDLARDFALVAIALLSLWLTPEEHRKANGFSWEPIKEVAKLFAAIFVCVIPVLAMLDAGDKGTFHWLLAAVTRHDGTPHEVAYFWLTGVLSAFLDNAPTYLVFFQLAGGDPVQLMGPLATTLKAISMGAVFMGALTYIGNAPNFMVYSIAQERGVGMPSFFGYMLWSSAVLLPVLALVGWLTLG